MRMNQCEVSDKLCVAFILRVFEHMWGHNGFISFWPVEKIFQENNPTTFLGLPYAISARNIKNFDFSSCATTRSVLVDIRS